MVFRGSIPRPPPHLSEKDMLRRTPLKRTTALKRTPFKKKPRKPVRKVSTRQQQINRELRIIKRELPNVCCICGKPCSCGDLMHLLPRSLNPEYITEPWNLAIGCRSCHDQYDNNIEFRQKQIHIFGRLKEHDEQAARRYFRIYE